MTKHIKFSTALSLTFVALVAAVMLVAFAGMTDHTKASGVRLAACDNVAGMGGAGAHATSTPVYLGAGTLSATSTMPACAMGNASSFALNVRSVSTTTAATLVWVVQTSMDGIDWYNLDRDEALTAAQVTHNATTTDSLTGTGIGTFSVNYVYPTFGANYVRLKYSGAVASSTVYLLLNPINQIAN